MPISDEAAINILTQVLKTQDELIKSLREENKDLVSLLLEKSEIVAAETITEIPDSPQAIGRKNWRMRRTELEKLYAKRITEATDEITQ